MEHKNILEIFWKYFGQYFGNILEIILEIFWKYFGQYLYLYLYLLSQVDHDSRTVFFRRRSFPVAFLLQAGGTLGAVTRC